MAMHASEASVTVSPLDMTLRDDLFEWLSSQDAWQQDLAKRLAGRPQLAATDYDEALRVVKARLPCGRGARERA